MKMSGRSRGMVLLVAGIAITASAQLNPTVAVLPKAALPVPLECEQGLAPQRMARLDVSQIPEPQISAAANVAPPSVMLRETLRSAQSAAEQNNRRGFTDALARARTLVESFPPGSERTVAADVVKVFNDVDRIWTWQFDSPTGAFFDASSPLLAMLRTYAGYDAFVADDVITTGGTKLYPSHESRMFLLRESARRLARLGVRSGVQVTERAMPGEHRTAHALPPVVPRKASAHRQTQHAETKHATASSTKTSSTKTSHTKAASTTKAPRHHYEKKTTTTKAAPKHVPRHEPAKVAEAAAPKHEGARYDKARTHETTKAGPPPVATPVTTPVATTAPAGSTTATTPPTTSGAPPATATASTSTTPATTTTAPLTNTTSSSTSSSSPTSTTPFTTTTAEPTTSSTASPTMSDTTATTSTAAPSPAAQPNRTRNVVLPIILILLGVGVLVVLFRASS
jgi:hypothetical protein